MTDEERAAKAALIAAFAAYQDWQEESGDWDTFLDWAADERIDKAMSRVATSDRT